jgi:alpha-glucuronidase
LASIAYQAWLQKSRITDASKRETYGQLFASIAVAGASSTPVMRQVIEELTVSICELTGIKPVIADAASEDTSFLCGTLDAAVWTTLGITNERLADIKREGYLIMNADSQGRSRLLLIGGSDTGVLYGIYHLLRLMRQGEALSGLSVLENPANPLRMINHWDNADGSIERGYAGKSILYRDGQFIADKTRLRDYARLMASIGINCISINNVNVHARETRFITEDSLPEVARVADIFRSFGIRLFLSINYAAPIEAGGLDTADPLDIRVGDWWARTADAIYRAIPDFGGFVVKADSEHRPGPFTYGRDHADGANMLGDALAPHGGLVIWRCFVYNCMQDWRDRKTDRARAAYDHFQPLDGRFRDNVLLQIKNGPMDFQVREPVSPLLGALRRTNQLLEFQITQEYTGQQRHLCYLVPQWKTVLDFDTHAAGKQSTVRRIASGELYGAGHGGLAAVTNVGDDDNWTGHTLAQANLYGYGRLAWNPGLTAEAIAEEWIRLTVSQDEQVVATILGMLMGSWSIYENYTAPLGVGWMVAPNHHYGPDVDGYEYSRWGTYHFADRDGIGVDRTSATGTGYASQYAEPNAAIYESLESCPDELLLFFHHVEYTHRLQSGKTVIQHIYDTHYEGVDQADGLVDAWSTLRGQLDDEIYSGVMERLRHQATHAREWRDIINTYFYRKSGIPDAKGRTIY